VSDHSRVAPATSATLLQRRMGEFPFVNHGFGHGQKGAIVFLVVEP
jgi:hypothetical protein